MAALHLKAFYNGPSIAISSALHRNRKMNTNRFSNMFWRVAGAFRVPSRRKIELNYLNQSISINDLERRQHEIETGKFHSY
jgi:hypothetical protein